MTLATCLVASRQNTSTSREVEEVKENAAGLRPAGRGRPQPAPGASHSPALARLMPRRPGAPPPAPIPGSAPPRARAGDAEGGGDESRTEHRLPPVRRGASAAHLGGRGGRNTPPRDMCWPVDLAFSHIVAPARPLFTLRACGRWEGGGDEAGRSIVFHPPVRRASAARLGGKGGRNTPRQGCLGTCCAGPGTWPFPISWPPRAPCSPSGASSSGSVGGGEGEARPKNLKNGWSFPSVSSSSGYSGVGVAVSRTRLRCPR